MFSSIMGEIRGYMMLQLSLFLSFYIVRKEISNANAEN